MVVVGAPTLAKRRVGAAAIPVIEERLSIHLDAANRNAEVLGPLRLKVGAHRLVESVRVVRVGEALDLGAGRVPCLVLGFRRRRVELPIRVDAVAEGPPSTLSDQPAGRRDTGGRLVAQGVDERVAVDRGGESVAPGLAGLDTRKRTG